MGSRFKKKASVCGQVGQVQFGGNEVKEEFKLGFKFYRGLK
jgi:hypothetical protein